MRTNARLLSEPSVASYDATRAVFWNFLLEVPYALWTLDEVFLDRLVCGAAWALLMLGY